MAISYTSMPTITIQSISSPRHDVPNLFNRVSNRTRAVGNVSFWLALLLSICIFLSTVQVVFIWQPNAEDLDSICSLNGPLPSMNKTEVAFHGIALPHPLQRNLTLSEMEFFKEPDGVEYVPCLHFTEAYERESIHIVQEKHKFLLVVASGGLNKQRNQIVDAVVIARILEAALVIPVLQANAVLRDDSEFSDIFDVDHFKNALKDDVHIVSSLPSTHLMRRPVQERETPLHSSPKWFRAHYLKQLNQDGVLLLSKLDSRLSEDLPRDLQKLRCKVAFHALRFAPAIMKIANMLSQRLRNKGPYVALHLQLEKDVWVRTGCLPGLGPKYDDAIREERSLKPKFLAGCSNLTSDERKAAGLCPLNAAEVARLLKALGASPTTNIFWAGGKPLGGDLALHPLFAEFSNVFSKGSLASEGELAPFSLKSSMMAAIDYMICLHSDVFIPSHGGNMARALQGNRAYAGQLKHIIPNKKEMLLAFSNSSLSAEEFDMIIRNLHRKSMEQPVFCAEEAGRDVTAFPVADCMCSNMTSGSSSSGSSSNMTSGSSSIR